MSRLSQWLAAADAEFGLLWVLMPTGRTMLHYHNLTLINIVDANANSVRDLGMKRIHAYR